jgi:hypothetical protein
MSVRRASLLLCAALAGCIAAEPAAAPDAGRPRAERPPVAVGDVVNAAPSARVAELTGATTAMLRVLLERSREVVVLPATPPGAGGPERASCRIDAAITDLRDEPAGDGAEPGSADPADLRRRAVVTMQYAVLDRAGGVLADGTLTGDWVEFGAGPLPFPSADDLASGAYWVSPYGRATRACLDELVRIVGDRVRDASVTVP